MKRRRIALILGLALAVCLLATPALATTVRTVTATLNYNDIKILIDGEEIIPTDVNGDSTEPFIINGSTYVPIRAIAEAFGYDVDWDEQTCTVIINTPEDPPIDDYFRESEASGVTSSWADYVTKALLEAEIDESVISPEELPDLKKDMWDAFFGMDVYGMNPVDSEYMDILEKIDALSIGLCCEKETAEAFCSLPNWVISRDGERYFLTASDGENQLIMMADNRGVGMYTP